MSLNSAAVFQVPMPMPPWGRGSSKVRGLDRGGEGDRAAVFGEESLDVVAGDAEPAGAVEVDEVDRPAFVVGVAEEGGIGGHDHDVGVPFHSGHEGGFAEGAAEVAEAGVAGDGVFPDEDLRALAVVGVVFAGVVHEPLGGVVVVFIDDGGHGVPGVAAFPVVGDQVDVGVSGLDGADEQGPAFAVGGPAVLVADLEVFEAEGGGVAVAGAEAAPDRVGGAVGVLDGIEGVLHPLIHDVHRGVLAMGHAGVDAEQRFRAEVLGHLEVFMVADGVGGLVAPDVA
jgi:hypothetical protein